MDNKYVDTLLIIFCIIGFVAGVFIVTFGTILYNIIVFILLMVIIFLLVYKFS